MTRGSPATHARSQRGVDGAWDRNPVHEQRTACRSPGARSPHHMAQVHDRGDQGPALLPVRETGAIPATTDTFVPYVTADLGHHRPTVVVDHDPGPQLPPSSPPSTQPPPSTTTEPPPFGRLLLPRSSRRPVRWPVRSGPARLGPRCDGVMRGRRSTTTVVGDLDSPGVSQDRA